METDWFPPARRPALAAPSLPAAALRAGGRRPGVAGPDRGRRGRFGCSLLSIGATSMGGFDALGLPLGDHGGAGGAVRGRRVDRRALAASSGPCTWRTTRRAGPRGDVAFGLEAVGSTYFPAGGRAGRSRPTRAGPDEARGGHQRLRLRGDRARRTTRYRADRAADRAFGRGSAPTCLMAHDWGGHGPRRLRSYEAVRAGT